MLSRFLDNIKKVDSNNKAINFIIKRFSSEKKKYRGMQVFQHNRYDDDKMYKILESIKFVFRELNVDRIKIPKGDENNGKNNGFYLSDYPEYEMIVKKIKEYGSGGTANTLKKNYFPDWEKSGIIKRYKNNTEFSLNSFILNNSKEKWIEKELYKFHINALLPENFVENIYYLLKKFEKITYYEFLLFFSYIYSLNEIEIETRNNDENLKYIFELIESWRNLSDINKRSIIENLKEYMNPKHYRDQSKDIKKDWGNFNNETQQIFDSLKNANLFQITTYNNEKRIVLRINEKNNDKIKFKRNKDIYETYHTENHTKKQDGFQMDHIVKFSLITKYEDVPYIDNYLNLLYIDGHSHSVKTQKGSNHMILKYDGIKLALEDYRKISESIPLEIEKNVLIDKNKINKYIKHNQKLINRYFLLKI